MNQKKSFLNAFFSFNLTIIAGIIIGCFINLISNEVKPVLTFLFSPTLYIISSLIAVTFRLVWWIAMEKGTMFEAKHVILQIIQDVIIINVVILSTLSTIFLWETYLK